MFAHCMLFLNICLLRISSQFIVSLFIIFSFCQSGVSNLSLLVRECIMVMVILLNVFFIAMISIFVIVIIVVN